MQDFRNLVVWQKARRLTKFMYQLTADFPSSEEFGLKAQMRRASVSVCSNIAEGCGRRGDREFRRFLDMRWARRANWNARPFSASTWRISAK
jgi:hypothetical protein